MRKIILVVGLTLLTTGVFANEGKKSKKSKDLENYNLDQTACCTGTASVGSPGTVGYVSVTVTKCHTSLEYNTAKIAACHNANVAAKKAVASIEDSYVVISGSN